MKRLVQPQTIEEIQGLVGLAATHMTARRNTAAGDSGQAIWQPHCLLGRRGNTRRQFPVEICLVPGLSVLQALQARSNDNFGQRQFVEFRCLRLLGRRSSRPDDKQTPGRPFANGQAKWLQHALQPGLQITVNGFAANQQVVADEVTAE